MSRTRRRKRCPCGEVARKWVTDWDGTVLRLCPYHHKFWVGERVAIELRQARLELAESMCDDGTCTILGDHDEPGAIP